MLIYLNGKLVPQSRAKIPVLDYGFLYGYGLFETMRAYNGKIFRLEAHLERLAESAAVLNIPADKAACEKAVREVLKANQLKDARVRLMLTPGEGDLTVNPQSCTHPSTIALVAPYTPPSPQKYSGGYKVIYSAIRRNSQSPLPTLKTANYLESLLARQEAKNAGADDALLLNDKGFLAEASSSNIFVVSRNILKTPPLGSGILPGITRRVVLELASQSGIDVQEIDIKPEELQSADEVFITNSMIELMPVTSIQPPSQVPPFNKGRLGGISKSSSSISPLPPGGREPSFLVLSSLRGGESERGGINSLSVASGLPGSITLRLMVAYREIVRRQK